MPLPRGYVLVYDHHFQRSSSLKPLGQSKPNFMWSFIGKRERQFIQILQVTLPRWLPHPYMVNTLKIFSYRTNSPMIMKLGMEHYVLKLYKIYNIDDPELIMSYFSSPEPKAHGELIVYQSSRHPSVRACVRPSVHIFKYDYLHNQQAYSKQILSEASLGWRKRCVMFCARSDWNSGFHGNG